VEEGRSRIQEASFSLRRPALIFDEERAERLMEGEGARRKGEYTAVHLNRVKENGKGRFLKTGLVAGGRTVYAGKEG